MASLGDNQEVAMHHEKAPGQNGRCRQRERHTKRTHQVKVKVRESVEERRVHEHIDNKANSVDIIPTDETGMKETVSTSTDANAQEQGGKEVEAEVSSDEPNVLDMNGDESR